MLATELGAKVKIAFSFQAQEIAASQADAAGTAVDLKGYNGRVSAIFSATSVASTGAAISDIQIEQADDSAFTVNKEVLTPVDTGTDTDSLFANVATGANSLQKRSIKPSRRFVRFRLDTGTGTSGAHVCGLFMIGGYADLVSGGPTF